MARDPMLEKDADEFELIPVSPLRRMEKRIEELEVTKGTNMQEFYREMVDIIKMNQEIVDELAKANDALRIEISRLPSKLDDLVSRLDELISFIKASATEEMPTSGTGNEGQLNMGQKLDQLVETNKKIAQSNQAVLDLLDNIGKKMSRPPMPPLPPRRQVLLQTKPS